MKKLMLVLALCLTAMLALAGCGADKAATPADGKATIKVGATPVPHAEILNIVKPMLEKEGVVVEIVEMTDYVIPNTAVADKQLDANFFQHKPYLDKFCSERNLKLTSVAPIHIEPMGVYSKKVKALSELAEGAEVAIPNDPTNGGRALLLLAKHGVITLKDGVTITASVADIVANPKKIKITELEAPQLPRVLDDVAIAVINTNFAMEADLIPMRDAIVMEDKESPYANILVVRTGDESRPEIQKLVKALTSPEVKKFIEEKYKGSIAATF